MSARDQLAPPSLDELYCAMGPAAGLGIWHFVFATGTFVWSHGLRVLFDIDGTEAPSFELFDSFIHPDDRDGIEDFLRGNRAIGGEFRIIRRNGSLRWISHEGRVFHDANQRPIFAAGMIRDVTSRVEALRARDLAQARIQSVMQTTLCFTWVTTEDGGISQALGWAEITGQSVEQIAGLGWLACVYEADRDRTRRAWLHSLETKTSYATKYRLLCRDGVTRWFIARNEPVFDSRGALVEWFGVAFDISDLKEFDETFFRRLENPGPTGPLVRSARALLDWSINDLAHKSGVSVSSIRRFESGEATAARDQTMDRLTTALRQAGIEFLQVDTKGAFVRLRTDKTPAISHVNSVAIREFAAVPQGRT